MDHPSWRRLVAPSHLVISICQGCQLDVTQKPRSHFGWLRAAPPFMWQAKADVSCSTELATTPSTNDLAFIPALKGGLTGGDGQILLPPPPKKKLSRVRDALRCISFYISVSVGH